MRARVRAGVRCVRCCACGAGAVPGRPGRDPADTLSAPKGLVGGRSLSVVISGNMC